MACCLFAAPRFPCVLVATLFREFSVLFKTFTFTYDLQEHLSLFEVTCVCQSGEKTLSVFTATRSQNLQPLQIRFNSDLEMEAWQADIINGMISCCAVEI